MVIPGCVTSGRSVAEFRFSHILSNFLESFASVSDGDGSCDGWWILGQSYMTCSHVSTDDVYCVPYFVQPVLELRVGVTSTQRRLIFP